MKERIDLVIFRENNKEKRVIRDCAFMNCLYCKEEIFLLTDKVTFCRTPKCKYLHKFVYKLRENPKKIEGFDRVLVTEVEDYKKTTLWEAFENEI